MLEIWVSVGYLLLLAVVLTAWFFWRKGTVVAALVTLIIGVPLWFWWEYARPTWTTGIVSGTEVRRSDADSAGNTRDVQYVYMRNRADAGVELVNEDSWWWFKRNSERVFNDAKTAEVRNTEVTVMWNRWRSQIFSFHPNVIAFGKAGAWPFWSWRIWTFYALSAVVWFAYFSAIIWLYRRTDDDDDDD